MGGVWMQVKCPYCGTSKLYKLETEDECPKCGGILSIDHWGDTRKIMTPPFGLYVPQNIVRELKAKLKKAKKAKGVS